MNKKRIKKFSQNWYIIEFISMAKFLIKNKYHFTKIMMNDFERKGMDISQIGICSVYNDYQFDYNITITKKKINGSAD